MTQTIEQFIASAGLSMTVTATDHNSHMDDTSQRMDHWRCTIRAGRSRMSLVFSMGSGHHGKEPELAEVLGCLAGEASGVENARDFADWCSEYGYGEDSRKAERTYRACYKQAARLRSVLGDSAFETLLWGTEQ